MAMTEPIRIKYSFFVNVIIKFTVSSISYNLFLVLMLTVPRSVV